jgi:hypothetical protein
MTEGLLTPQISAAVALFRAAGLAQRNPPIMPFYSYTLLAPLLPRYFDDGKRDLLTATCRISDIGTFKITAIGKPSAVELIRSELLDSDGNYTKEQATSEVQLVDHMINVISLSTGYQVERVWIGQDTIWVGSKGEPDGTPNLSISLSAFNDGPIDQTRVAALFEHTIEHRRLFKLVRDTQQPLLPLPYRYLSAYRVIELDFKIKTKWPDLPSLLAPFEVEYRDLNISKMSFENYIHAMRDKCAHLSAADLRDDGEKDVSDENLQKLFELLKRVMFSHLATKFPLQIEHPPKLNGVPIVPPDQKPRVAMVHNQQVAEQLEERAVFWEIEAKTHTGTAAASRIEYAKQTRAFADLIKLEPDPK